MTDKVSLQLEFVTTDGKKVKFTIPNPKQPVDNTAVDSAMDLVVAKGIFTFPQGAIAKKSGASLVESQATTVG